MRKGRILVVDDDSVVRDLLAGILGRDHDIVSAANGGQTLAALEAGRAAGSLPDLIMLDVELPDSDGFELCKRIKSTPGLLEIPVLFVTARSTAADETDAFDIGAVDFITKPFNPSVVRARVRTHMELKRNRDALERLAYIDGLTGLHNRRAFDEALAREWRRLRRDGEMLSVILCDVDHFKQFNDMYGHGAGDECLRRIGAALKATTQRPADLVARYGGEEFVMLLPGTGFAGAQSLAKAAGDAVAALLIPHATSSAAPHVTVSLGVATAQVSADVNPVTVLEAADRQLYASKAAGRARMSGIDLSPAAAKRGRV